MADNIVEIHRNKKAIFGKKYYDKDSKVYIGLRNGRLQLQQTPDLTDIEKSIETLENVEPVVPIEYTAGSGIAITNNEISYSGLTPVSINIIMAHIDKY